MTPRKAREVARATGKTFKWIDSDGVKRIALVGPMAPIIRRQDWQEKAAEAERVEAAERDRWIAEGDRLAQVAS